jgi:hypothetical protein
MFRRPASLPDPTMRTDSAAYLASARVPDLPGPGPATDRLRSAYLGLLKLSLCDLVGPSTTSVGRTEDGRVLSRELVGDEMRLRAAGMDWPMQGLTMVGLARLDDLQSCVEEIVADGIDGDLIEAGAWRGGASILMRATLDSLGADDRTLYVADSFQGLPHGRSAPGEERDDLGVFGFLAVPLEQVQEAFARFGCDQGVEFLPGFFELTLERLRAHRWSLIRLDADTYEATLLALETLYPGLSAGGHLIVDDYGALDECSRAVDEFRRRHSIEEPLEEIDWTGVRWRRADEPALADMDNGSNAPTAPVTQPSIGPRNPQTRVPTERELQLEDEISDLRARIASADAEIGRLRQRPIERALRRLRRDRRGTR